MIKKQATAALLNQYKINALTVVSVKVLPYLCVSEATLLQRHQKLMALQTDTDPLYTVSRNKLHRPALET